MAQDATSSLGIVETKQAKIALPAGGFKLENGDVLKELTVAYETYGRLLDDKSNVIFICHALSGDAHVAGIHKDNPKGIGWWDNMVGPGKGIDTNNYFVVCANVLGGCKGTTGPSSIDPETGKPYGSAFPMLTVGDIVDAHTLLLRHLGIDKLAAVIGGSFGGLQVIEWSIRYPDMIKRAISIASSTSLSTQALAFDIVGRKTIVSDPDWNGGDYYGTGNRPESGLAQARMIGHITYLSQEILSQKFGRERLAVPVKGKNADQLFKSDFQIESYLDHQGEKFVDRFDANSYLHISRAMDEYDVAERFGGFDKAFGKIKAKLLIVALSSDWLFTPDQSAEFANRLLSAGKEVSYCLINAPHGHDAFLVDVANLAKVIKAFLPWVGSKPELKIDLTGDQRKSFDVITGMIPRGAKVIDLGCGDGTLLDYVEQKQAIWGMGIDISLDNIVSVIDKGFDIFQSDIDNGLQMIPDHKYEYAVLNETLQEVRKPREVLREVLRIADQAIVTFPNFAHWLYRVQILFSGRMPKADSLPFEWYNTPNIHLFTLKDFKELCRMEGIEILQTEYLHDCCCGAILSSLGLKNLGASKVIVRIARKQDGGNT